MAVHLINKCTNPSLFYKFTATVLFPHHNASRSTLTHIVASENLDTNSEDHRKEEDQKYEQNIKDVILNNSLLFVNELGWSRSAIIEGAKQANYPGAIHGLFPSPGAELVQFFYTQSNLKLAEILKEKYGDNVQRNESGTEIAKGAIETRLRMVLPYKKRWPQAMAIMALPPNVPQSLSNLLTLADDICYYAGDRSVDLTWYSRRIGTAAIYKMTELFMLQDDSPDQIETWNFLGERMVEASAIKNVLQQSDVVSAHARETMTSAISMARNILGLHWRK